MVPWLFQDIASCIVSTTTQLKRLFHYSNRTKTETSPPPPPPSTTKTKTITFSDQIWRRWCISNTICLLLLYASLLWKINCLWQKKLFLPLDWPILMKRNKNTTYTPIEISKLKSHALYFFKLISSSIHVFKKTALPTNSPTKKPVHR